MSPSPHRLLHDLYRGPKLLTDPGNGGIIHPNADLLVCELRSGASSETRVLANPTKPGIQFILRMKTDGGGDIVVSAANGLNSVPEVSATLGDVGDMLSMISVSLTATTYRWEVLERTGAAIATATGTATSTATATSTTTSSATGTSTSSATASTSGATTSASATLSSTGTSTTTASATGTSTSTRSATATATGTQ